MHADHRYERVLPNVISAPTYEGGVRVTNFQEKSVTRHLNGLRPLVQ